MNIAAILAGISTAQKLLPVMEEVGREIGPLVETELADGKAVWSSVEKALSDLKVALSSLKVAAQATPQ